ncbi:MAG: hypothetical protein IIC13_15175 [SAR324 cluster bacterium]|nr:hypothetical protein [SAR324 cluster bacterium]
MAWIALATEDELSEAVGYRLLEETMGRLEVNIPLRQGGFGYLKKRIGNFYQMAQYQSILLLTDLDQIGCPSILIDSWIQTLQIPENFLFRVAVRETEAWLLADHDGMSVFLGAKVGSFPENPDLLTDPKAALLTMAKKAPREIRHEMVAQKGAIAAQGVGYNAVLSQFIREKWNPERASGRSESLRRARKRIKELSERI